MSFNLYFRYLRVALSGVVHVHFVAQVMSLCAIKSLYRWLASQVLVVRSFPGHVFSASTESLMAARRRAVLIA